ncbi:MAG: pyroglutamyl-peptidase I [Defluviitaleaceae bacterium]|nr:pyroglutamyl-peptidase I [Defluviitaleaceae bacterium]
MKILITGFEPFGGEEINPSYEAVKLLPQKLQEAEILTMELPVVFGKCAEILVDKIADCKPDVVICVGQAGGRPNISIEKVAINHVDARIADNAGNMPTDETIIKDAPAAYFTNLPIKAMVENMRINGIPAAISYTAGTFVCNDIMYHLLHMINTQHRHIRGGFIHVPFDCAQAAKNNAPSMPIATIAKGLEYAIEAAIDNSSDIVIKGGETH